MKSVRLNLRITALQIVNDIRDRIKKSLHEDTIRKILKKAHCHGRVVRRNHIHQLWMRKSLYNFRKWIRKWISSVLESDFYLIRVNSASFASEGVNWYVRRKEGTTFSKKNLALVVKHGEGGIMVWGCMAQMESINSHL